MKTFEVAVPLKYCKKVIIEPCDELGELMVIYRFPLNDVNIRNIDMETRKWIFNLEEKK